MDANEKNGCSGSPAGPELAANGDGRIPFQQLSKRHRGGRRPGQSWDGPHVAKADGTQPSDGTPLCLHCTERKAVAPRGLCNRCYMDLSIRCHYPVLYQAVGSGWNVREGQQLAPWPERGSKVAMEPDRHMPGSEERIEALRRRVQAIDDGRMAAAKCQRTGLASIFHPDDLTMDEIVRDDSAGSSDVSGGLGGDRHYENPPTPHSVGKTAGD